MFTSLETFFAKNFNLKEKRLYCAQQATEVTYGNLEDCNINFCVEHNIKTFNRTGNGGCIIHENGNIIFALYYYLPDYNNKFFSEEVCYWLRDYLVSKGINAIIDKNDLLIDGYNVASGVDTRQTPNYNWCFSGFQININNNLPLIKSICTKELQKVPKGLSEFGVTSEEIFKLGNNWFNTNWDANKLK